MIFLLGHGWSNFSFYAKGVKDGIIGKENLVFTAMENSNTARQEAYIRYVLQERPYEKIIDNEFCLK